MARIIMCYQNVGEFKKGQFYEATWDSDLPFYRLRPELSEEAYIKIHRADYNSSFVEIDYDALEMETEVLPKPKMFLGFNLSPNPYRESKKYRFLNMNHRLLRLTQSLFLPHFETLKKIVISEETFQAIEREIKSLQQAFGSCRYTEEELMENVELTAERIGDLTRHSFSSFWEKKAKPQ